MLDFERPYFETPKPHPTETVSTIASRFKTALGRATLVLGLASGPAFAVEIGQAVVAPDTAAAETATFTNDYPDADAVDCHLTYGQYSWCKGDPTTPHGPRGFDYRNCTDGVAYWANKYVGVAVPGSWNDAKYWSGNASSYMVYSGDTNSVEPGDVAQDDTGAWGHVGFVTAVGKDKDGKITSIRVAEMNKAGTGDFSWDTYTSKNTDNNFIRNASGDVWNHFIDLNGAGKGLNNEDIATTTTASTPSGLRQPSAIEDPSSGRNIFFAGRDNYVHQWSVIGGHWSDVKLLNGTLQTAEPIAIGTSPSAVEDPNTGRNVFYTGADNAIWQWSVQNGAWHNNRLGGNVRAGTSPSAIVDPGTGRNVFYVDTSGAIEQLSVQGNSWVIFPLGGIALEGSSPSAVEDPSTGRNVFYEGLDKRISQFSVMGNGWVNVELNDPAGNQTLAAGSSPDAMVDSVTGRNVFYTGPDNNIWQYSVQNGAWHNNRLIDPSGNQAAAAGATPNAVQDSATGRNIFYTGADNQIWQYSVQNGQWHNFKLLGAGGNPNVDANTSPGAVVDPPTGRNIFYFSNGMVYQWSVQNNTWTDFQLQP